VTPGDRGGSPPAGMLWGHVLADCRARRNTCSTTRHAGEHQAHLQAGHGQGRRRGSCGARDRGTNLAFGKAPWPWPSRTVVAAHPADQAGGAGPGRSTRAGKRPRRPGAGISRWRRASRGHRPGARRSARRWSGSRSARSGRRCSLSARSLAASRGAGRRSGSRRWPAGKGGHRRGPRSGSARSRPAPGQRRVLPMASRVARISARTAAR